MEEPGLEQVIEDVKKQLAAKTGPLMETLLDLMIISEVWSDNGRIHIVAWIPDLHQGKPRYQRKHIIYDTLKRRVVKVENAEKTG